MTALGRRCLLLKERHMKGLQSDLAGRLYREFDAGHRENDIETRCLIIQKSLSAAIEQWVTGDLKLSKIRQTEVFTATDRNEAVKVRTERIIKELSAHHQEKPINFDSRLRIMASLSSFAISEHENEPSKSADNHQLLLGERECLCQWVGKGAVVRCIISPDISIQRVKDTRILPQLVRETIIPRLDQLIEYIRGSMEIRNLQFVFVGQLPHHNLLVRNSNLLIEGRRRGLNEPGFPITRIIFDPIVIQAEIEEFDALFLDAASLIRYPPDDPYVPPERATEEDLESDLLKE